MPHSLIPSGESLPARLEPTGLADRRTSRALSVLGNQTRLRLASVQAQALVQTEKLHEIDRLSREAITGQAMLNSWADTLTQGDARLFADLNFFIGIARMAKGEIIADTVSSFCQEGRS